MNKIKAKNNIPQLRFPEFNNEWKNGKLDKIALFMKGRGISKNDIIQDGKNECIRYGELYTEYDEVIDEIKSKTNIRKEISVVSKKNDLLFPSSGETNIDIATVSCVKKKNVILGGDINIAKLSDDCDGEFFAYYLSNYKKRDIAKFGQGHSVVHLYSSHIKNLQISIPQKKEQEKIAEFLESVDQWIENLETQKTSWENYKKGMMQKLFPAKDQKVSELRFKDKNGNDFPVWEEKKLTHVGEIKTGTTPQTKNKEYYNGKIPWITPTDIADEKNIYTSAQLLTEVGLRKGRFISKNSLLVTCIASIGKNAVLRVGGSCNQQINAITPNQSNDVDFLYYLIEKNKQKLISYAGAGGMLILNKKDFSNLKFLFPSLSEQKKIADFLSVIDDVITVKDEEIAKAREWKKGLMQKMFV